MLESQLHQNREFVANMIKLTLNPDSEAKVFTFDKEVITIGSAPETQVDVSIALSSAKDIHIKIIEEDDRFIVVNAANDPFTSLNGLPFGKKPLKNFDQIEIDQIKLQFEFVEEEQETTAPTPKKEEPFDIDALMKEVEALEVSSEPEPPPKKKLETKTVEEPKKIEVKEKPNKYYLQDFDDESEQWSEDPPKQEEPLAHKSGMYENWKMFAGLLFAIIALSTVICSGVYFRASGKNSQEEKKIGAGIADIAMAMTHAKLNRITPNKQNWSDPDFIKNILTRVLSPNLHTQAQIDNEGKFTRYPYRLRVYTSPNMERFLVIAQPAPNLMQWVVHKKTIIIDSEAMEMRKITDLRALNRLLTNPSPLEGSNGDEITRVLKEGSVMSLNSLAGHKNHWGYSPPKALGFIRPGAENYIYNAPRYYPFGEELLRKAIHLFQNQASPSDVSILQEEMDEISNFNDIVLYTSQGLQMAVEAQKALGTFAPNSKFLVAYVKFNPKGFVTSSHLLMNEDRGELAFLQSPRRQLSSLLGKTNEEEADELSLNFEEENSLLFGEDAKEKVDPNHPLFLQLDAVYSDRKRALKSLSLQMVDILNQQNHKLYPNFQETFANLFSTYVKTDQQHQSKIIEELGQLYQEYSEMPLEEFMNYIDKARLTSFASESLNNQKNVLGDEVLTQEEVESHFELIIDTESLAELEERVEDASQRLTLDNLPDPKKLILFQDQMHNHVLEKLSHFLLSPTSRYAKEPLSKNDRSTLIHILENSWISDKEEYDYFLQEFNQLIERG